MSRLDTSREQESAYEMHRAGLSHRRGSSDVDDLRHPPLYAALDLGTNNCRLLFARPSGNGLRVVEAFSRIVRLGEGISRSNQLSDPAIRRTIEALKVCAERMAARPLERSRLIATEACRSASNGEAFLARVLEETGLSLEIVDRETEAQLAAAGCLELVDPADDGVVLFDIGGGSSEIVWLDRDETGEMDVKSRIRAWISIPWGVVTLSERHGGIEVNREVYQGMVDEVRGHLSPFAEGLASQIKNRRYHLLGTSGTVTTLGGVHLGLRRYERRRIDGLWMGDQAISATIGSLIDMTYRQRAAHPCIGHQRADLVLAGCAILDAIRLLFPSERLRIADRGLREGLLIGMMKADGVWHKKGSGA
jgi:exopolyphosphatase / guanosine-5'-triphosphate,3'-diphosphate pyrophosphatase